MIAQICNIVLLTILFTTTGCFKSHIDNPDTLRIPIPKVDVNLDPQNLLDAYSMAIAGQIYHGLFRFNPQGDVDPDLAESWTVSDDQLRYRIKLKPAKFSDGTPVTAKNVQMTFARMFSSDASMAADLSYVAGANKIKSSHKLSDLKVKPISDLEIEFLLSRPSALFLKHLAVLDSSILPILNFEPYIKKTVPLPPIYSGPYKLVNKTDTTFEIEKWRPDDLDSPNPPKRIIYFFPGKDPVELARSNQIDSLDHYPVSKEDTGKLVKAGWIQTESELVAQVFTILNPNLISDKVRAYLVSKVNTVDALHSINDKNYFPAFGLIPKFMPGEISTPLPIEKRPEDVEGSITLDYSSMNPVGTAAANYLKSVWTTPHFTVNLHDYDSETLLTRMFNKKSQAIVGRKGIDYPEGYSILTYFVDRGDNYFFLKDPKIDTEITAAVSILDTQARIQKYQEIQKKVLKHHTVIPLFFGSSASGLWGPKVKFVPPHPMGFHILPVEAIEVMR
jgi:ABC-type transport system substrate-binding protein